MYYTLVTIKFCRGYFIICSRSWAWADTRTARFCNHYVRKQPIPWFLGQRSHDATSCGGELGTGSGFWFWFA